MKRSEKQKEKMLKRKKNESQKKDSFEQRALFTYKNSAEKKSNDLAQRLIFTIVILFLIRLGSNVPIPGLDADIFNKWFEEKFSSNGGFFNVMTGGSFASRSILALNITPMITASLIIQFASMLIRPLEKLIRDEDGQRIVAQATRYAAMVIAGAESIYFALAFYANGSFEKGNTPAVMSMVFTMTAGAAIVLWFADLISEYGIGNGMTVILVADVLMSVPSDLASVWKRFVQTRYSLSGKFLSMLVVAVIIGLIITCVIVMQECEHRFPVQYSHGTSSIAHKGEYSKKNYIPMKLNSAGVMPVIFAQAALQIPTLMALLGFNVQKGILNFFALSFEQKNWFNMYYPEYSFGILVFLFVIIIFSYFYANISFNPMEIAEYLRESGSTIPGVRPGQPTVDYLSRSAGAMNLIGAFALCGVSLIPIFISSYFNINLSLGGTSLIIIVGGITETVQRITADRYQQRVSSIA